jgi:hypothetical protein
MGAAHTGVKYNNQLATVAMDGVTAMRWQQQWMAQRQRTVVASKTNLELEAHPNTLQASSPYA